MNTKNNTSAPNSLLRTCLCLGLAMGLAQVGVAQTASQTNSISLYDLGLDQLINLHVTSVTRTETLLNRSPAAISVITQEDIRRSGLTSLPELLRLVPGMDVARINASEWGVTARGFNGQFANKLLVLIDGRTVYNPVFAGVSWDVQDLVLEDLDRIEVIRGPGATLWGANTVNGVVNIITKSAKETQGLLVSAVGGTVEQPSTSVRYGGQLGTNLFYRVYVKYVNHADFDGPKGFENSDAWSMGRGGARIDWNPNPNDRLTLQGDYYNGTFEQLAQNPQLTPPFVDNQIDTNHNTGGNVLARWSHDFSDTSQLNWQVFYDRVVMQQGDYKGSVNTYDLDLQHQIAIGKRQAIVWGVGYRYYETYNSPSSFINWDPSSRRSQLGSAFVQDDVAIVQDRLHLILGSKFEHNDFTGFEVQPSGRLLWTPTEHQTAWGAISRAVRTPAEFERDSILNYQASRPSPLAPPTLIQVSGQSGFEAERTMTYELGYRIEPVSRLSFDLSTFYNSFDGVGSGIQAGSPYFAAASTPHVVVPLQYENALCGQSYGGELSAQWQVMQDWRLMASYSFLHMKLRPDDSMAGDAPQHQAQLRSYLNLPHHLEFNNALYYVGSLPHQSIPSNFRLDLGLVWHPSKSWEIGIWGQNVLDGDHVEYTSSRTTLQTEIPRTIYGKLTWRF